MKNTKFMCAALVVGVSSVGTGVFFSAVKSSAGGLPSSATSNTSATTSTATSDRNVVPTNLTIIPGRAVGNVQIGDSQQKVHKVLGAWSGSFLDGRLGGETETYAQGFLIRYSDYKVVEINVTSKKFLTHEAISVGRSRRQIQSTFKGGVWRHNWWYSGKRKINEYIYDMVQPGIAFRFGENFRSPSAACQQIQVNRPNYGMNGGKLLRNGPR